MRKALMTTPTSRVRDASPSDSADIAAIYSEAIESGQSTMDTEPVSADYFDALMSNLGSGEALLVCEDRLGTVGWGIVKRYSDRPGYSRACETSVYVAEDRQGRGHGSALLRETVERAKTLGYRHLVAKILAVNERSVRFHERFGYEVVGRQRAIGFLRGRPHDVVIMQRVFSGEEA